MSKSLARWVLAILILLATACAVEDEQVVVQPMGPVDLSGVDWVEHPATRALRERARAIEDVEDALDVWGRLEPDGKRISESIAGRAGALPEPWAGRARRFRERLLVLEGGPVAETLPFARLAFELGSTSSAVNAYTACAKRESLPSEDALRCAAAWAAMLYFEQAREALGGNTDPGARWFAERVRDSRNLELDLDYLESLARDHQELVTVGALQMLLARDLEPSLARRRLEIASQLFRALGDSEGAGIALAAIGEMPDPEEVRGAEELLEAGNESYEKGRHELALGAWRQVLLKHPSTPSWGKALFNLGLALMEEERWKEAISIFERLIASDVDDEEPGGNLMENYQNYRHRSALQLSSAFESLGDPAKALEWALAARDRYPLRAWCGTCAMSEEAALSARIERFEGE